MAESKSNKQYFDKQGFIKIYDEFWTHDAERTAKLVMHSKALLTAKMFSQLASPAKVLFLISGPTGVVF